MRRYMSADRRFRREEEMPQTKLYASFLIYFFLHQQHVFLFISQFRPKQTLKDHTSLNTSQNADMIHL
jgi:hypothetical protein